MWAKRSSDTVWVNRKTSRGPSRGLSPTPLSLCSLPSLSSACGGNRFDTRVLMNLISLMCLCSLSPKSLLLFNGVLQSYLISPLVVSQHAGSTDSQFLDAFCNLWKTGGTPCLADLCYHAENRPWQKYSECRYYSFFSTLNSAHDCLSASTLIPFYSLFTVSALVLSPLPPPRLSHIPTNEAGCLYDS